MRRWAWRILLAALVVAALTGSALAADIKDENFVYEEYGDGLEVKDYIVKNRTDKKKQSVSIPEMYQGKPVRSIGEYAFGKKDDPSDPESSALRSITIPNSVDHIAPFAFTGASALESIEIPGGVVIDESAFEGNQNVRSIEIHDDVSEQGEINYISASIGERAFKGCSNLQTVLLPSSLKVIKEEAFSGCSELKWIVIPFSVQTLETNAFKDCSSLENVVFRRGQVRFASSTGTELATAQVFPTLAKIDYFHCLKNSETYDKIFKAVKRLAPAGTNEDEFAASKVHPIQVSPERETPSGLTKPRCKVKGNETNGTNGTITSKFTCAGYDVTVKTEVTKPDGTKEAVTKQEHKDCDCEIFKNSTHTYTQERKVSAPYHKLVEAEDIPSTCEKPGYTNRIKCSECGADLWSKELSLAPHTYDEDSKTEDHPLFDGYCSDGSKGLILVTKTCSVCKNYTPTCWTCQKLEWELTKADAALAAAQEAYDEAKANEAKAVKALEDAQAAKTAADTAAAEAKKKVEEAQAAADDAEAKLDALGADATEEEKAAAKEALDNANEALLDAKMAEDSAKRAADAAGAAVTKAQEEKDAATNALTNPINLEGALNDAKTGATAKKTLLSNHVKLTAAGSHRECPTCNELREAIDTATGSAKKKAEAAYEAHYADSDKHPAADLPDMTAAVSTKETDKVEHVWGKDYEKVIDQAVCGTTNLGKTEIWHDCTVCGTSELKETITVRPAKKHTPDPSAKSEVIKEATCTEEGLKGYAADVKCAVCGHEIGDGFTQAIPPKGHDYQPVSDYKDPNDKPATCTEDGQETTGIEKCTVCGELNPDSGKVNIIPALGHDWGDFVPNEGQDMTPNETCVEKKVKGSVSCKREGCGEKMDDYELTIEGLGKHTWGEWKADEGGKTETRTCSVCKKTETRNVSAPEPPDDPDDPDDPDKPDKPGEPEKPKDYSITVVPSAGGAASASSATAKSGASITLTVTPSSGYELDMMRAISGGTSVLTLTDLGGGKYRFTMPENNVEVRVTFARKSEGLGWGGVSKDNSTSGDPRRTTDVMPTQNPVQSVPRAGAYEQLFRDIPMSHWAAGEINWANQMGYMNGAGGRFNPDGNITHQQMWMVLARLTGNHPASMTEARRWAVDHSFADGSSPTGPVLRHQLVTALYRCAHLMGSTNRNTSSLAGYPDSRTVPTVARDAFSWAVANGIVGGTGNGRLAPNGTLTRAQFAVILYRYSQQI